MKDLAVQSETAENPEGEPQGALEKLGAAIEHALDEVPAADVLGLLTGAFVSLTLALARQQGFDVCNEVKVDGGRERDITIHAPKAGSPAI